MVVDQVGDGIAVADSDGLTVVGVVTRGGLGAVRRELQFVTVGEGEGAGAVPVLGDDPVAVGVVGVCGLLAGLSEGGELALQVLNTN